MDMWLNFARSPTSRDILNALILTTVCACGDAAIINFFFNIATTIVQRFPMARELREATIFGERAKTFIFRTL